VFQLVDICFHICLQKKVTQTLKVNPNPEPIL